MIKKVAMYADQNVATTVSNYNTPEVVCVMNFFT